MRRKEPKNRRQISKPKSRLSDILMTLPSLTKEERQQVRLACGQLGVTEPPKLRDDEEDEKFILFYNILANTLREIIGGRCPNRVGVLPPRIIKHIRDGWIEVEDLIEQINIKPTQSVRLRFYQLIVISTIDHISSLENVPISLKNVAQQLSNCGAIMNKQFPNYMRAGLMRLVLDWGKPTTTIDKEDL